MQRTKTAIEGLEVLQSRVFADSRGYFQELFNQRALAESGITLEWKQDNLSVSHKNVVRGLHYQITQPQAKLIRVLCGAVYDVAVDLRKNSPTFGRHVGFDLRAGDGQAVLIPAGFAHGFVALEPDTVFLYKVNDYYAPQAERTLLWNDPALGISWPVGEADAIVSAKDALGLPLREAETFE